MRRYWVGLLCALLMHGTIGAQSRPAPQSTEPSEWTQRLVGSLSVTQIAFKDWQQGGEEALAWIAAMEGDTEYDARAANWSTTYNFAFGQSRIKDRGLRKIEDKIDMGTVLTWKLGAYVNPYAGATLKTQFATGFGTRDSERVPISRLFDPAYLTQSVGAGYQPLPQLKTRLGIGVREILADDFRDRYTQGRRVQLDGGLEPVVEVDWPLSENVYFSTKVEMFFAFERFSDVVVRTDHAITTKVSSIIRVGLRVQVIRDRTASMDTQMKQALTFGLSYAFL